jgi:hypothetical protein
VGLAGVVIKGIAFMKLELMAAHRDEELPFHHVIEFLARMGIELQGTLFGFRPYLH